MTPVEPRIFLVGNDLKVRADITALLQSANLKTYAYDHPLDFFEAYDPSWIGCVISDIPMPEMSGLELQKILLSRNIMLPVIFLTAFNDIETAVEAMKLGAFDFLVQPYRPQYLLDRTQQAIKLHKQYQQQKLQVDLLAGRFALLTDREKEVMNRIVKGKANKVIAQDLKLSQKTVEFHRAHVMTKMKANSVAELVCQDIILSRLRENPNISKGTCSFIDQDI